MRRLSRVLFALVLPVCLGAFAADIVVPKTDVTKKNGNFFLSTVDVATPPGGLGMSIERVYNSKADFTGIFGEGWGSVYEEKLEVEDDGSLIVHEYGGGAANAFAPTGPAIRSLNTIIAEIMGAAEKTGEFGGAVEEKAYRARLATGHNDEWIRFRDLGLVKSPEIPVGATFSSSRFGTQVITRVPEGYQRQTIPVASTDTKVKFEAFDLSGRLQRVWDADHNFIALHYDSRGRLSEMDDNLGNRFTFVFNADGFVERITDSQGRVARYEYDGKELIKSVDANANTYQFEYDTQYDNMIAIRYSDHSATSVTYLPYDQDENVDTVKDRDGTFSKYTYIYKKQTDGTCLETVEVVKTKDSKQVSDDKTDYTVDATYCPAS